MADTILVAGGSGLVGANLTPALRAAGHEVLATRFRNPSPFFRDLPMYDLTDFDTCLEVTRGQNAVVFCAGLVAGSGFHHQNPTAVLRPNLQITSGLLEACARNRVPTAVLISSTTVYPPADHPVREEEGEPDRPLFPGYYAVGWMYRYLELLAHTYCTIHGMRIVILRPTNIYGPHAAFDPDRSHVVAALIRRALARENPFEIWGSPQVTRDFLYVGDLVSDIMHALGSETIPSDHPINVGCGTPLTVGEAAGVILEVCDHRPDVRFNPDRPTAIPYRAVSTDRYREYFGEQPRTDFRTGITRTVEWYLAQRPTDGTDRG